MHATIQKPLEEILDALEDGEKVMIVGCGNCAAKAKSGGEPETEAMAERLRVKGVAVTGWAVPPNGGGLCKLDAVRKLLNEDHEAASQASESFLVLACGQGEVRGGAGGVCRADATDLVRRMPRCVRVERWLSRPASWPGRGRSDRWWAPKRSLAGGSGPVGGTGGGNR